MSLRKSQSGNVFFALFGAIALLGVLGATVATFIKGPLTSSVKVTRTNVAESQMAVVSQVAIMQSAAAPNCDADPQVEPIPWRVPGGIPAPTGGGLIPTTMGVATTKDPWGSEYGYCVWDHGASSCGSTERLAGTAVNSDGQTVIALVSAGPDKTFTTTCRTFAAADVNSDGDLADAGDYPLIAKANSTDDDILFTYSYAEASGASGGLWSLKSSDNNVATIAKDLEVAGSATFSGTGSFTGLTTDSISARTGDFLDFMDGLRLPDAATFNPTCNGALSGVMRRNSSAIQMCVSNAWTTVSGSGSGGSGSGAADLPSDTTTVCNAGNSGRVRYNTTSSRPEFCDGAGWRAFVTQTGTPSVSIVPPLATGMNVTGPCSGGTCPYANGSNVIFTITNTGPTAAAITMAIDGFDPSNFQVDYAASTCDDGGTVAPGATCLAAIQPRAAGNFNYNSQLEIYVAGTLRGTAALSGTSTGFGCTPGVRGWGGIVATCANGTTPDYVLTYPGCSSQTVDPYCHGGPWGDPQMTNNTWYSFPNYSAVLTGAQYSVSTPGYLNTGAVNYCLSLVQDGYDNWYLPSFTEWQGILYANRAILDFDDDNYWTSTWSNYQAQAIIYNPWQNTDGLVYGSANYKVRCLRRHGVADPAVVADTTPVISLPEQFNNPEVAIDYNNGDVDIKYTHTSGGSKTSALLVVSGINTSIPISVSGSGSPTMTINGVAGLTSSTVTNLTPVRITATAPTTAGTEHVVTLTAGTRTFYYRVRYVDTATVRKIFVTEATYNGNLGGFSGADTRCQTAATGAGLTGNWMALLSTPSTFFANRIPWNWGRLETTSTPPELVANNLSELYGDVALANPIRYNESGVLRPAYYAWTGNDYGSAGIMPMIWNDHVCNEWTSSSSSVNGSRGFSGAIWGTALGHGYPLYGCNNVYHLYCIGPF